MNLESKVCCTIEGNKEANRLTRILAVRIITRHWFALNNCRLEQSQLKTTRYLVSLPRILNRHHHKIGLTTSLLRASCQLEEKTALKRSTSGSNTGLHAGVLPLLCHQFLTCNCPLHRPEKSMILNQPDNGVMPVSSTLRSIGVNPMMASSIGVGNSGWQRGPSRCDLRHTFKINRFSF
jgi:hypothetical protein